MKTKPPRTTESKKEKTKGKSIPKWVVFKTSRIRLNLTTLTPAADLGASTALGPVVSVTGAAGTPVVACKLNTGGWQVTPLRK